MIAKLSVLVALLAVAQAGYIRGALGGVSQNSRQQDDAGNYAFNYQIVDGLGARNGRWEAGDAWGNKQGSYNIADIDGRVRRVEYVADGLGFRAAVKTNEPGTAASLPAAAAIVSPYGGPVAQAVGGVSIAHAPVAAVAAPAIAPVATGVIGVPGILGGAGLLGGKGVIGGGLIGAPGVIGGGLIGAPGVIGGGLIGAPGVIGGGLIGAPGIIGGKGIII